MQPLVLLEVLRAQKKLQDRGKGEKWEGKGDKMDFFSQQCFGDISAAQQQREVREIPSPRTGENGFAEHPWPLLPGDKRNEQGLVPRSSGARAAAPAVPRAPVLALL